MLKTQSTFEPWLTSMEKDFGWNGIIGRAPSEEEVKSALIDKDLFLSVVLSLISPTSFEYVFD